MDFLMLIFLLRVCFILLAYLSVCHAETPCGLTCTKTIVRDAIELKSCGGVKGACRVFVSQEQLRGNLASNNSFCVGLSGLEAAECVCRIEGQAIDPARAWRPWLSDNNANAPKRVLLGATHQYQRARDGRNIIGSGVNLLSVAQDKNLQSHSHEIQILRNALASTTDIVWTGTGAGGGGTTNQCGGSWLSISGSQSGTIGRADSDEVLWTDTGTQPCNAQAKIYCFEVLSSP
jgi:hypothetical protein